MGDDKGLVLNTNDFNVAKIFVCWEITKKIIGDTDEIQPKKYPDLYNYVFLHFADNENIDPTKFQALITK